MAVTASERTMKVKSVPYGTRERRLMVNYRPCNALSIISSDFWDLIRRECEFCQCGTGSCMVEEILDCSDLNRMDLRTLGDARAE